MNRTLIASLVLAATTLTFGASAFAQSASAAPAPKVAAAAPADMATAKPAPKKMHATKKHVRAHKKAAPMKTPA